MKIIETSPIEIGFVLWCHCQKLMDDPRILRICEQLTLANHICSVIGGGGIKVLHPTNS